ncbi:MAG: hypothetical protein FWG80_01020 [Alphaproteobacteria bacterium]|nr:hypothetical protein [Alphaproteobacteria bacterium]
MRKILFAFCTLYFTFYAMSPASSASFFAERTVTVRPLSDECIGNEKDPLCVFDTVIACIIRNDKSLCEKVGLAYDQTMRNAVGYLAGKDYKYRPVEMFVNRRTSLCSVVNDKACVYNPSTGKPVAVDMSVTNDRKFVVHLRRDKDSAWSVIFATEFDCWSDEDCS